ncbi:MAG: P-loop NTPase fold protein, partial [Porphyromonadaceae bacterium]|nr:P-loop NTPase fold protein [Porphyromonadaceae bacterium]
SLICMLLQYDNLKKQKSKNHERGENVTGFSNDNIDNNGISGNLKNYASLLVDKLIATDIQKHSYALGIVGEWGVGKTTFLEELKTHARNKAEIVNFNPWMCRTPEQVILDFFASLKYQLSPKYSSLSKSIKEYAKSVSSLTFTPYSIFTLNAILPSKEESLYVKKRNLSEKLLKLPKPVMVFIDDLDRLEREEIFEVLRLIRNTADLSNIIYVVAYDKDYVTSVLEEKNIKDASSYLEKIFPVEIFLPKVEDYLIWEVLGSDISQHSDRDFQNSLFKYINKNDDRALILKILNSYRRAKRFSRLYMLNISYMKKQLLGEIKLIDLFWLTLLQVYDKRTYDSLAQDPSRLLYPGGLSYNKSERYFIRDGIITNGTKKAEIYTGERFWKEESPQILRRMFDSNISTIKQSICYLENYEKYFSLSISKFKLSIGEMKLLLSEKANPKELVKDWVDSGKYFSSIIYQMEQVDVNQLKEHELQNFLHGVLYYEMNITQQRYNGWRAIKNVFLATTYRDKTYEHTAKEAVLSWIDDQLTNWDEKELISFGRVLSRMYVAKEYDEFRKEIQVSPLVISNEDVESSLKKLMAKYLEIHPELTALDVLNEKSSLGSLFKSCVVIEADPIDYEFTIYKQVIFDPIVEYFSKKEAKPTFTEFDRSYNGMFRHTLPNFDNPIEEEDARCAMEERYHYEISSYFGNSKSCRSKFKEFRLKCFVEN